MNPSTATVGEEINISVTVHNTGTSDVSQAVVAFTADNGIQSQQIYTTTIDIPYNSSKGVDSSWRSTFSGSPITITATIDPNNDINELNELNNSSSRNIEITPSNFCNLSISENSIDFTPNPADSGKQMVFSITVNNTSSQPSLPTELLIYINDPTNSTPTGTLTVGPIQANSFLTLEYPWEVTVPNDTLLYIIVDPDDEIDEFREDDNEVLMTMPVNTIAELNLPLLNITTEPEFPKTGDVVTFTIGVMNSGEQNAENVTLKIYEDFISEDNLLTEFLFNDIDALASAPFDFDYNSGERVGEQTICLVVDPDNSVAEINENNNTSCYSFFLQEANLWLDTRYFSPNGDNIKDTVTLHFNDQNISTVSILNQKDRIVKTLEPAVSATSVTWDGRDENGLTCLDGSYLFTIGETKREVTLDINKSSLIPALKNDSGKLYFHKMIHGQIPGSAISFGVDQQNGALYILYQNTPLELRIGVVTDDTITPITPPGSLYFMYPHASPLYFSPDNSKMLFSIAEFGETAFASTSVFVLDMTEIEMDGEANPLLIRSNIAVPCKMLAMDKKIWRLDGNWPQFHPFNSQILYTIIENESLELQVMDSAGMYIETLATVENWSYTECNDFGGLPCPNICMGEYLWSPFGDQIIYVDGNNLRVVDIQGQEVVTISLNDVMQEGEVLWNLDWSYESNTLMFLIGDMSCSETERCSSFGSPWTYDFSDNSLKQQHFIPYFLVQESEITDVYHDFILYNQTLSSVDGSYYKILPYDFHILDLSSRNDIAISDINGQVHITGNARNCHSNLDVTGLTEYDGVQIEGTAFDAHFDNFILEYKSLGSSQEFQQLGPRHNSPVLDDTIQYWFPPGPDNYLLRMTVADKAGNVRKSFDTVEWTANNSIANIHLDYEVFSPKIQDGRKDYLTITYAVIVPMTQVDFFITDANNTVVWEQSKTYFGETPPFQDSIFFDGKNNTQSPGEYVADGMYSLNVNQYKVQFAIDNEQPNCIFSHSGPLSNSILILWSCLVSYDSEFSLLVSDPNLLKWEIEYNPADESNYWIETDHIFGHVNHWETVSKHNDSQSPLKLMYRIHDLPSPVFQLKAEDKAGNIRVLLTEPFEEEIRIIPEGNSPDFCLIDEVSGTCPEPVLTTSSEFSFCANETIIPQGEQIILEFRYAHLDTWSLLSEKTDAIENEVIPFTVYREDVEPEIVNPLFPEYDIDIYLRVRFLDVLNREFTSSPFHIIFTQSGSSQNPGGTLPFLRYVRIIKVERVQDGLLVLFENYGNTREHIRNIRVYGKVREFRDNSDPCLCPELGPEEDIDPGIPYEMQFELPPHQIVQKFLPLSSMISVTMVSGSIDSGVSTSYACNPVLAGTDIQFSLLSSDLPQHVDLRIGNIHDLGDGIFNEYRLSLFFPDGSLDYYSIVNPQPDEFYIIAMDISGFSKNSVCLHEILTRLSAQYIYQPGYEGILTTEEYAFGQNRDPFIPDCDNVPPEIEIVPIIHSGCPQENIIDGNEIIVIGIPFDISVAEDNTLSSIIFEYKSGQNSHWLPIPGSDMHMVSGGLPGTARFVWDTSSLAPGFYQLRVTVGDDSFNVSSGIVAFDYRGSVEISPPPGCGFIYNTIQESNNPLQLHLFDEKLLSPLNIDGFSDYVSTTFAFHHTDSAFLTVSVLDESDAKLGEIISQERYEPGPVSFNWDGRLSNHGDVLTDGKYSLEVSLVDSCGHEESFIVKNIVIDNTPPSLSINHPSEGALLDPITDIWGMADDEHFVSYTLSYAYGETPIEFTVFHTSDFPIAPLSIIGSLNTHEFVPGTYTIQLSSTDKVNNATTTSRTFNVPTWSLITQFTIYPQYISPETDNPEIASCELSAIFTKPLTVSLIVFDGNNNAVCQLANAFETDGVYSTQWSGTDDYGQLLPDGLYTFKLYADDGILSEEADSHCIIDTTVPLISIATPEEGKCYGTMVDVFGSLTDEYLAYYSFFLVDKSNNEEITLTTGNYNRINYSFYDLSTIPDGHYTLRIKTGDQAGNRTEQERHFTLDREAPGLQIESPLPGSFWGLSELNCSIEASISEENLSEIVVSYTCDLAPSPPQILETFVSLPSNNNHLLDWDLSSLPDDQYHLHITVSDCSNNHSSAETTIIIDQTPPFADIIAPYEDAVINDTYQIIGSASDAHFENYTIELARRDNENSYNFTTITSSVFPVSDGTLFDSAFIPPDGPYLFRLTVYDKAGNFSRLDRSVTFNTEPPLPPSNLVGSVNVSDVLLSWQASPSPDVIGYYVYRDGLRISSEPVLNTHFTDENRPEGSYEYSVTAIDIGNLESIPCPSITLLIDGTAPVAKILFPLDGSDVGYTCPVLGNAYSTGSFDFLAYELSVGAGNLPTDFTSILTSSLPVHNGLLYDWDTTAFSGTWTIELKVTDTSLNTATDRITVELDHIPPPTPQLLSINAQNDDVHLEWTINPIPPDLAGFLIYRNNVLCNAPAGYYGSVTPYIITASLPDAQYENLDVPDGNHTYRITAIDQAGLESNPSNSLSISIDTSPPEFIILYPEEGSHVSGLVMIAVQPIDEDIESFIFQYDAEEGMQNFSTIGSPVTEPPWQSDVITLFMDGRVDIRVGAMDISGNDTYINSYFYYDDLEPPLAPEDLDYYLEGEDVILTWEAFSDDIAGYRVYRDGILIHDNVLEKMYRDVDIADGNYTYTVTAFDSAPEPNESEHSNPLNVVLFTPVVKKFFPIVNEDLVLEIGNIPHNQQIIITNEGGELHVGPFAGAETEAMPVTIEYENFGGLDVWSTLIVRGYKFDVDVNKFRYSESRIFVNAQPEPPPNINIADTGNGQIDLNWQESESEDRFRYMIEVNDHIIHTETEIIDTFREIESSVSLLGYEAERAFDGDIQTAYSPDFDSLSLPVFWSIEFNEPFLIKRINLLWCNQGNKVAEDFIILGLLDGEWIELAWFLANYEPGTPVEFPRYIALDGLKLIIHSTVWGTETGTDSLLLSEIELQGIPLWLETSDSVTYSNDGQYLFKVLTHDTYGGLSTDESEEIWVVIGNEPYPPPRPRELTIESLPEGNSLKSRWLSPLFESTEFTASDLVGYFIYRSIDEEADYILLNTNPVTETFYTDTDLKNGQVYYYKVRAVYRDYLISGFSEPAFGIAYDAIAPHSPDLFYPTVPAENLVIHEQPITVCGLGNPAHTVNIYNSSTLVALGNSIGELGEQKTIELNQSINEWYLHPDGHRILLNSQYSQPYSDDFENGPGQLIAENKSGIDSCSGVEFSTTGWNNVESSYAHSGIKTWSCFEAASQDAYLTIPNIWLPPDAILSFWHTYNLSHARDGAVIEISEDNGVSWTDLNDYIITQNNYDENTIPSLFCSPIAGRRAWFGDILGAMVQVKIDLSTFGQQVISLRWRLAGDQNPHGGEWHIDDVLIESTSSMNQVIRCYNPDNNTMILIDDSPGIKKDFCFNETGSILGYTHNGRIITYDFNSHILSTLLDDGNSPELLAISANGDNIFYSADDTSGRDKIFVVQVDNGATAQLTPTDDQFEDSLIAVSPQQRFILFHRLDTVSGFQSLHLLDKQENTETLVSAMETGDKAQFDQNEESIFYISRYFDMADSSYHNDLNQFFIQNHTNETLWTARRADASILLNAVQMYPTQHHLVISGYDSLHSPPNVVYIFDLPTNTLIDQLYFSSLATLALSSKGWIYNPVQNSSSGTYYELPGFFEFDNVSIQPGWNYVRAMQRDENCNYSPYSAPLKINFESDQTLSDLAVGDFLLVFPEVLTAGQNAFMQVGVSNEGTAAIEGFEIAFYVQTNQEIELIDTILYAETFLPGDWTPLAIEWTVPNYIGQCTLFSLVDPLNLIDETSESNNSISVTHCITASENVSVELNTDRNVYSCGEVIGIDTFLFNSGNTVDVSVKITVSSEENNFEMILDQREFTNFSYGDSKTYTPLWQTYNLEPGNYRVFAEVMSGTSILDSTELNVTLTSETVLDCSLRLDKPFYLQGESVIAEAYITNASPGMSLRNCQIHYKIEDMSGTRVYETSAIIHNLPALSYKYLHFMWPAEQSPPGDYSASISVTHLGIDYDSHIVSFNLRSASFSSLSGNISNLPTTIGYSDPIDFSIRLMNAGNVNLDNLNYSILLIDGTTEQVEVEVNASASIPAYSFVTFPYSIESFGLSYHDFVLVLKASVEQNSVMEENILDTEAFAISDIYPPLIQLIDPADGGYFAQNLDITLSGTDDLSGIAEVYYILDQSPHHYPVPLVTGLPTSGIFETEWDIHHEDIGPHSLTFYARDNFDNYSDPISLQIFIVPQISPIFSIVSVDTAELNGNGNDVPEKGEEISLKLGLLNEGTPVHGITATITNTDGNAAIIDGESFYGTFTSGEIKNNGDDLFTIDVADFSGDFARIEFQLTLNNQDDFEQILDFHIIIGIPPILFVDDDNDLVGYPSCESLFLQALEEEKYAYHVWDVSKEGFSPNYLELSKYRLVIWNTGDDKDMGHTLNSVEQGMLTSFLDGGGSLFLAGQNILTDLSNNTNGVITNDFLNSYIGINAVRNDTGAIVANGIEGHPISDSIHISLLPSIIMPDKTDALILNNNATPVFYNDRGETIAVKNNENTIVFISFPIENSDESLNNPDNGTSAIKEIVHFLLNPIFDSDFDGILDVVDNCPYVPNTNQLDNENDGIGDVCDPDDDNDGILDPIDNCPLIPNFDQLDSDNDGSGDVCDEDDDNDSIVDWLDNCPLTPNPDQVDTDNDSIGNACDPDDDNDGILDPIDNCPLIPNFDQLDSDNDGSGDVCDEDDDNDSILDWLDNCPLIPNYDQLDTDNDGLGDVCDDDDDNDTIVDWLDNCPLIPNPNQSDNEDDGLGDVCDPDDDNDGVEDTTDNCPLTYNPDQLDLNDNGIGDACEEFNDRDFDGITDNLDCLPDIYNPAQMVVTVASSGTISEHQTLQDAVLAAQAGSYIRVCAASDSAVVSIEGLHGSSDEPIIIEGVEMPTLNGFSISGSSFITIQGFNVENTGGTAFFLDGSTGSNQHISIMHNNIFGSPQYRDAIYMSQHNFGITITYNEIYENGRHGIQLKGPGVGPFNISNNNIHHNGGHGVYLFLTYKVPQATDFEFSSESETSKLYINIRNNQITDNDRDGIHIHNQSEAPMKIKNNTIMGNGSNGIRLFKVRKIRITGNTVSENGAITPGENGFGISAGPVTWSDCFIPLTNNTICYNHGIIDLPDSSQDLGNCSLLLDGNDTGNVTTCGCEGDGIVGTCDDRMHGDITLTWRELSVHSPPGELARIDCSPPQSSCGFNSDYSGIQSYHSENSLFLKFFSPFTETNRAFLFSACLWYDRGLGVSR